MVAVNCVYSNIAQCTQLLSFRDIKSIISIAIMINPKTPIMKLIKKDEMLGRVYDITEK